MTTNVRAIPKIGIVEDDTGVKTAAENGLAWDPGDEVSSKPIEDERDK
jgi:hypothetical protein